MVIRCAVCDAVVDSRLGSCLVCGTSLSVELSASLPDEALADGRGWRGLFEDRAAAVARKEGLPPAEAEPRAYEIVLVEWLNANPPPSSGAARCAYCRAPLGEPGRDGVPVLTPADREVWLHHGCWSDWTAGRRAEAAAELARHGVPPPASPA